MLSAQLDWRGSEGEWKWGAPCSQTWGGGFPCPTELSSWHGTGPNFGARALNRPGFTESFYLLVQPSCSGQQAIGPKVKKVKSAGPPPQPGGSPQNGSQSTPLARILPNPEPRAFCLSRGPGEAWGTQSQGWRRPGGSRGTRSSWGDYIGGGVHGSSQTPWGSSATPSPTPAGLH